jgi:hypothetical protein
MFVCNFIGCMWVVASYLHPGTNIGWIQGYGFADESEELIYITALYFAITSLSTCGFGDILPKNIYELLYSCIILVGGVSLFSYILSNLANHFSDM